jgi:hypothetical protein
MGARLRIGSVVGAVLACALILVSMPGPARAAAGRVGVEARAMTASAGFGQAAAESACPITKYGHTGYYICGTKVLNATWNDGHTETFVIGTDHAVWHIASGFSGWRSMGGQASNTVSYGYSVGLPLISVYVSWASWKYWCSFYLFNQGGWSPWEECSG